MRGDRGVTLIELMVVVAIIGILTATATMTYIGQQRRAAQSEARTNLMNLRMLEEQFFAENGKYTISLGAVGKDNPNNVKIIQDGGTTPDPFNALSGFKPGSMDPSKPGEGLSFSYWIEQDIDLNGKAQSPCFRASAQGNTNSRVAGDLYAIDCNNNRSF